jgi:hypothetical protein
MLLGANFKYVDNSELSSEERAMIENDKEVLDKGGHVNNLRNSKCDIDVNVDMNISGKYVRLKTGMYKGFIGRVSVCPEGTTPCNVKVAICIYSYIYVFLYI